MEIIIGADIVPTGSNLSLFESGDIDALIGKELHSILDKADVRIFNLEIPLCDTQAPIAKNGPNLISPTAAVRGIKALDPSLLTLANNHILDQGEQGLRSTQKVLSQNKIPFTGIGSNVLEAGSAYIINCGPVKIGVYACTDNEFTIAKTGSAGANPFDPLESPDHIVELKQKCDYVIVLYHGGKEFYRYPSPYLQKVCRKLAQKGADLILCQHSHCIGCFEKYLKSTIVYGQGNFLFDGSEGEYWQTSLLVKVSFNPTGTEYIPIKKAGNGVRLAEGKAAEEILKMFYQRSYDILQDGFVEKKYQEFAAENHLQYIRQFAGFGKWMNRIDQQLLKGLIIRRKYSRKQLLALQNYIECDAHRELLIRSFY